MGDRLLFASRLADDYEAIWKSNRTIVVAQGSGRPIVEAMIDGIASEHWGNLSTAGRAKTGPGMSARWDRAHDRIAVSSLRELGAIATGLVRGAEVVGYLTREGEGTVAPVDCVVLTPGGIVECGLHAGGVGSVRTRHPEHVLADIGEDQVGRDRRDLVQPHLAPLALDVVFARVGEPAEASAWRLRPPSTPPPRPAAWRCWRPRRTPCRRRTAPPRGGTSCRPPPVPPRRARSGTARPGSGRSGAPNTTRSLAYCGGLLDEPARRRRPPRVATRMRSAFMPSRM